ncbi:MAG: T9SS type A sorting domain-containing protein [Bacteroidetes bacterium]|nr:MAG: T9SS type A sorting domain-containing protein [Bacteroidota bacterium]
MTHYFTCCLFFLITIPIYSQQTVGLFRNDSLAQNGYTLFAPGSTTQTYLIDNCGRVVHTWQSTYRPGEAAYLLENGNLLRTARIPGLYNGGGVGGRIELFDWSGNLLWGYNYASAAYHAHHDVEYLPNGNILVLAWEGHTREEAIEQGRNPALTNATGVWFEQVVELEPVGTNQANIVWEWHLIDHLVQDFDNTKANYGVIGDHPELLDVNFKATAGGGPGGGQADWAHFNSVDYNPALDQIIVNSRSLDEFYILDHSTSTAEAAGHSGGQYGRGGDFLYRWGNPQSYDRGTEADRKLWGPHDPHWIQPGLPDAGKIMIFNNGISRPGGSHSSVDVIDPPVAPDGTYVLNPGAAYGPDTLVWTYVAPQPITFYSANISGAQRQPNGNTLICEGASGHFFETDPAGNIHWDYINPVSMGNPVPQGTFPAQNSVFRTYRYTADYPAFAGRDLTPGNPVELNPLPSDCQIYTGTTNTIAVPGAPFDVRFYPNPVKELLYVELNTPQTLLVQLVDLAGRVIHTETATGILHTITMSDLPSGFYFVRLLAEQPGSPVTLKIIKQ